MIEVIKHHFHIDVERGVLHWKVAPRTHPRLAGVEAGGARRNHNGKFYWVIRLRGRAYKRGRLIFLIAHGRWPEPCVDHRNGNSLDDRLDNLREATVTENAWNHKGRKKRLQLPMGVRVIGSGRFQARLAYRGTMLHLGAFDTPNEAHAIYLAKRKEMYREFA